VGGGSCEVCTCDAGARCCWGCCCWTEPVVSPSLLDHEKGFSKRLISEQAETPAAIAINANARGHRHERDNPTTQDMAAHPYATTQFVELTPGR
jgi:hypothetical protein